MSEEVSPVGEAKRHGRQAVVRFASADAACPVRDQVAAAAESCAQVVIGGPAGPAEAETLAWATGGR